MDLTDEVLRRMTEIRYVMRLEWFDNVEKALQISLGHAGKGIDNEGQGYEVRT